MWQEIQGSLGRGMACTMHVVVAVSLVSGVVGLLLATKVYVLQELFAGLLSVAILFAAGVVVLIVFVSARGLAVLPPLGQISVETRTNFSGGVLLNRATLAL
jgi:hypothetical protein